VEMSNIAEGFILPALAIMRSICPKYIFHRAVPS
jgi:hypothetical protein